MLRAACIQMNSVADVSINLLRAGELLQDAAEQGVKLALLPENFAFMGANDAAKFAVAETENDSHVLGFLSEKAASLGISIIGGSVLLRGCEDGRLRNTSVAFSAEGKKLASYDKMHLFDVDLDGESYRESDLICPGNTAVDTRFGGWCVGLSICYDLRFSELYRHYSQAGCELLSIPSAFTVPTGKAHWETLLRARAIENQCYVMAAGQWGKHPGGSYTWGHSMIIDQWGEVMATQADGDGVIIADLSRSRLQSIRRMLPVLTHRRDMI